MDSSRSPGCFKASKRKIKESEFAFQVLCFPCAGGGAANCFRVTRDRSFQIRQSSQRSVLFPKQLPQPPLQAHPNRRAFRHEFQAAAGRRLTSVEIRKLSQFHIARDQGVDQTAGTARPQLRSRRFCRQNLTVGGNSGFEGGNIGR